MQVRVPAYKTLVLSVLYLITLLSAYKVIMKYSQSTPALFTALSLASLARTQATYGSAGASCQATNATVDLDWHAPVKSNINSLKSAINGTGIYGYVFNSSVAPLDNYNWCNMPHTNPVSYPRVTDSSYKLQYVEVLHRHHKRTPYAADTFPVENYPWYCDGMCRLQYYEFSYTSCSYISARRRAFLWRETAQSIRQRIR